jgi:hypothetical protein
MSETTENTIVRKEFLDYQGLARFLADLRLDLTVNPEPKQAGQQVKHIREVDGKIILEYESFGGDTEEEKAAARHALGVPSTQDINDIISRLDNAGLVHVVPNQSAPDQSETTIKDNDNQDITVPARTVYLKGFTRKPPVQTHTTVTQGRFFIRTATEVVGG